MIYLNSYFGGVLYLLPNSTWVTAALTDALVSSFVKSRVLSVSCSKFQPPSEVFLIIKSFTNFLSEVLTSISGQPEAVCLFLGGCDAHANNKIDSDNIINFFTYFCMFSLAYGPWSYAPNPVHSHLRAPMRTFCLRYSCENYSTISYIEFSVRLFQYKFTIKPII
jgi:hypothetical protein